MTAAILSVLLFGLVHPGSKIILGTGISLLHFCLLYSGFRLLSQLPVVLIKRHYLIQSKTQLMLLIGMGFIGAALQLTEFKGISDGLPISVVTFLLYSYPVWTVALSAIINGEKITTDSIIKVALSLAGLTFILGSQVQNLKFDLALLFPLIASIFMATWICLSNLLKKKGCNSWSISFYYDLFVFATLSALTFSGDHTDQLVTIKHWMFQDFHAIAIISYAIFLGVVPNLLFYKASQKLTAMAASLILLFEPVISSLISAVAWQESLTATFLIGALLLLASNISYKNLFQLSLFKIKKESL